jgi:predicted membrane metal-binding protein
LAPYFEKKFKFITEKFKLREIISSACAAQIFVLPLLLYKTGIFSLVALPVNLLILPFIPLTMFFGFTTFLLKIPFGWLGYLLTQYELFVVKIFSALPFAAKTITNFPLWLTLGIYAFYAIIIFKIKTKKVTISSDR